MSAPPSVTDAHIHVQPWRSMNPAAQELMRRGQADWESVSRLLDSPDEFLRFLDREGVERALLINYVAPEVMGFTSDVNEWVLGFVRGHADRLLACGAVHPRHSEDPGDEVQYLVERGIRCLKIHPPHMLFAADEYLRGMEGLRAVYEWAEALRVPVMVHTGTSVFPGARNRHADPIACDDVAVDFPKLRLILAHAGRPLYGPTAQFLARRHENVFLDLSGIPPRRLLHYVPDLPRLSGKCLWGTDWPAMGVPGLRRNVDEFLAIDALTDDQKSAVLAGNADRLFPR